MRLKLVICIIYSCKYRFKTINNLLTGNYTDVVLSIINCPSSAVVVPAPMSKVSWCIPTYMQHTCPVIYVRAEWTKDPSSASQVAFELIACIIQSIVHGCPSQAPSLLLVLRTLSLSFMCIFLSLVIGIFVYIFTNPWGVIGSVFLNRFIFQHILFTSS